MKSRIMMVAVAISFVMIALAGCGGDDNPGSSRNGSGLVNGPNEAWVVCIEMENGYCNGNIFLTDGNVLFIEKERGEQTWYSYSSGTYTLVSENRVRHDEECRSYEVDYSISDNGKTLKFVGYDILSYTRTGIGSFNIINTGMSYCGRYNL